MKVSVVDLSANQKKLQVQIPARNVQRELDKKYQELAKRVRLKGFRPGKIPRQILKSYYGKAVEGEVSNDLIQESFRGALSEADLKPLTEADVSEMRFEEDGAFTYEAIVDVSPPFEIEHYRGMELTKRSAEVSDEQVDEELKRIREQHAQLRTPEEDRPLREGDSVTVDFTPSVDGEVYEKGITSDYVTEVGAKTLHPDFDEHLVGRRVGDVVSFELDYPEHSGAKEIAGKRVHFDVTIKSLQEKVLPELDDDFAQRAGAVDTVDALRKQIRERLQSREEEKISAEVRQQIKEKLMDQVQFELSSKVIERETDAMIGQFRHQFESQGLKIDTSMFDKPEIRAEYRVQAEKNVRWQLIVRQIARQENIDLTDEELEETYREMARLFRKDVASVKRDYAESSIMEQLKDNRIQEKVFKLLEEEATYVEPSPEAGSPSQE